MNVLDGITSAVAGYFEQLRKARVEFWAKPSSEIGVDSLNSIVTAAAFVLARSRLIGLPTSEVYGKILIVYVAVVCIVAGIASLLVQRTASELASNIRRFLTTVGISSTIGAAIIAIYPDAGPIGAWWAEHLPGDSDTIPAALMAGSIGVLVIVLMGRGQKPINPLPSWSDWTVALAALYIATVLGLWVIIGLGR